MDSANKRARTIKILRYVIGAGIIVFALISFSGVCWCALGICSKWFSLAYIMTYWEILSISAVALFGAIIVRSFRKQPAVTSGNVIDTANVVPEDKECNENTPKWKELYDQLSDEERQKFKDLVKQHCVDGESGAEKKGKGKPGEES